MKFKILCKRITPEQTKGVPIVSIGLSAKPGAIWKACSNNMIYLLYGTDTKNPGKSFMSLFRFSHEEKA
jgi:hypothetical protein